MSLSCNAYAYLNLYKYGLFMGIYDGIFCDGMHHFLKIMIILKMVDVIFP